MTPRTTAGAPFFAALLCLCVTLGTSGQPQNERTWQDREGKRRSRAELDNILNQHKLGWESGGNLELART